MARRRVPVILSAHNRLSVFAGKQTIPGVSGVSVSVLGPLGFVTYTEDIANTIQLHDVSPHLYADDTQL